MKKLVSATALAGLFCVAGCETTDGPPNGGGDGFAEIDVGWQLLGAANDQSVACPPDATTAEVVSVRAGSSCPGPNCFVDCFDCTDGDGITAPLPLGSYDVHVNITDANLAECGVGSPALIAQSGLAGVTLNVDGGVATADFSFHVDGGFFQLDWDLVDAIGNPEPCEVDDAIRLSVVPVNETGTDNPELFDCDGRFGHPFVPDCGEMCGTTDAYFVGTYDILVDIEFEDNPDDFEECGEALEETIRFGNDVNYLGTFVCEI